MPSPAVDPAWVLPLLVGALLLLWQLAWLAVRLAQWLAVRWADGSAGARMRARLHPLHTLLDRRLPRPYRWLRRRLTPERLSGLPLTLAVAAAVYLAALFGQVVEALYEAEELLAIDRAISDWLQAYRTEPLLTVFVWITDLGGSPAIVGVTLVTSGLFWALRRHGQILPLWVATLGAQITTYLGKFAVDRARPDFVTGVTALTPSFPSGHATAAMALYGFIGYLIARERTGLRERFEVAYWTAVLIGLVGFSRVFLSVHYASDVVSGFLVGGFWLLVAVTLAERHRERYRATLYT